MIGCSADRVQRTVQFVGLLREGPEDPRLDRLIDERSPSPSRPDGVNIKLDATFSLNPSISSAASEGGFAFF